MRLLLGSLAVILSLTPVASRQLTAVRVSEGDDLQAAIDAARPGTTLLLAPGARFVGNFVLPALQDAAAFITIRTDSPRLPSPGTRTGPDWAGRLAVIQSPNNDPALRTAPRAHHWRLENLEFRANRHGYGSIIDLGDSAHAQRSLEDVPHTLVLDRLYITGDENHGQKRGIALNSGSTEIRNCYIAGIRGVGMDTQAIAGWNGPGPYLIENNYLEAAGENVMFGGADPGIPNLVPSQIVLRRNLLAKPVAWRRPIVDPPARVQAAAATSGGALPAGGYIYSVVAERPAGQGTTAVSTPRVTEQVSVAGTGDGSVRLAWDAVPGASGYRVYRTGPGTPMMWRTEKPAFTDTGAPGREGQPPDRATVWSVKNLFELKNARDVTLDGNVLERHWLHAQAGYAILLKPANQNGGAPWVTVEQVRIVNNVIRDVSSAVSIVGTDQRRPSGRARGITIANNLFVNIDKDAWGGAGDFLLIGGGPADVTVEHNTVLNSGRIISAFGGSKPPKQTEGFVFRNNVLRHNQYGVKGDGTPTGEATLARYFPGAVFEGNVVAGGKPSLYPDDNHFLPADDFEALFVAPGNYRLRPDSRFARAGANLDRIDEISGGGTTQPADAGARPGRKE